MSPWRVLAVDDEPLVLAELVHQLGRDDRVGVVTTARDGVEALRALRGAPVDVVFLDVNMPGLDGVEVAEVLNGQAIRPVLVFVTAYEQRAAEAYDLDAVDYVLKPLRVERIAEALNRVERRIASRRLQSGSGGEDLAMLAIDDGQRTYFVRRDDVLFVEAHRDYIHVHTRGAQAGVHVVRMPLATLEQAWAAHGFLRVHRSYLVGLRFITEVARDPLGGQVVRVAGHDLPVSRRQAAELRERVRVLPRRAGTAGESG